MPSGKVIVAVAALAVSLTSVATAADWFVSPRGDDWHDGSRERPLQTFAAAQQAVRDSNARASSPSPFGSRPATTICRNPSC